MRKLIVFFVALSVIQTSCLKDDSSGLDLQSDSPQHMLSSLALYNAIPGSARMEVFLNNELLNIESQLFSYGGFLRHRTVIPGKRVLKFAYRQGNINRGSEHLEVEFAAGKVYSMFFVGDVTQPFILVEDNLVLPSPRKIKVRFANLVMTDMAIDFGTENNSSRFFKALPKNKITDFVEMDLANLAILMTPVDKKIDPLKLDFAPQDRGVYTIWVKGYDSGRYDADKLSYTVTKY